MKTVWWLLLALVAPAPAFAPPEGRGLVRVRVEGPPGQSAPREVALRVRPTRQIVGNESLRWEVRATSPVRDGEAVFEVPAGRLDLRFEGAAVMPVYRWAVGVAAGETTDLGALRLERGATISGFVQTRDEKVPTHSILVYLRPGTIGRTLQGLDPKPLRTFTLENGTRPWGFFRFDGVAPGTYEVLAQEPGLPPAGYGPIVVEGDRSFELPRPLRIVGPGALEVRVDPTRDPELREWTVQVVAIPRLPALGTRTVTPTRVDRGRWELRDLPAGDYQVIVKVVVRGEKDAVWHSEKVHVEEQGVRLDVKLNYLLLRGLVTWERFPVQAELTFEGDGGTHIPCKTDDGGHYRVWMPAGDHWRVQVKTPEMPQPLILQDPVRLPEGTGYGPQTADIRIPSTRLPVEVVDEKGQAVGGAYVTALGRIRNQVRTDESGRFEIWGLRAGPQCLLAAHATPPRQGGETPAALEEEVPPPPLRLVVPTKVDVRGRLEPRLGSAAGALVLAWPAGSSGRVTAASAHTDEDGEFRISLPPGLRRASLAVLPPGRALRFLDADVSVGRVLEVPLDTPGGTLVLELGGRDPGSAGPLASKVTETEEERKARDEEEADAACRPKRPREGTVTLLHILRRWADLQGTPQTPGRMVVPNVEPGPYTLCATEGASLFYRGEPPAGNSHCTGGVLTAGGELALILPPAPPAPEPRRTSAAPTSTTPPPR